MTSKKALFICNCCGELLLNPEQTGEKYCPACGVELLLNQTYKELISVEKEN